VNKTLDISVIGLSCVDCIAAGEFRRPNVQNPVGDIRISAGGLGNALVALSGLDLSVGVATRIGSDMYGEYLLEQWGELGVNMSGVTIERDRPTGFSFVLAGGGERTPFYSAGTGSDFGPSDIPAAFVEDSRCMIVFFAGALPSLDGAPMLELVKRCHAAETVVILDTSDGVLVNHSDIPSYLPYANLVVNREEGRRITGKESPREILESLAQKGSFVAVTRPDGVSLMTPAGQYLDVPSPYHGRPVRNVVGAGDTFRAGLAAYIAANYDDFMGGRMDYREACLTASAVSYLFLSRSSDVRPFSMADVRALLDAERHDQGEASE
jgi:sugar/nucleoside kinase (ribokinase family)